jgi:xanthine dehydrogenase accessory factor
LQTALAAEVGYLGALGSRHTQAARAAWLTEHGVPADQLARIHGPAGLPIGSRTPAEIALSILAEMLQVRAS